jgi:hypothetical protein
MPAIGGGNPLPFQLGGGVSSSEQAYDALRQAVGTGGSGERDGIREGWRFARARGLAASVVDARVFFQWFPDLATDLLPMYEQLLGPAAVPFPDDSEQERRDRVSALWTRLVTAVHDELEARLQAIDPTVSIVPLNSTLARRAIPGRGFEDWDPTAFEASGPPFNIGKQSQFANYADDFVIYVSFPLPPGTLTDANRIKLGRIQAELTESLPAWVRFVVFTQDLGFILDEDLLDLTVFA